MRKKKFFRAIIRFAYRLKWRYEAMTAGPMRIQVDLGRKRG